MCQDSFLSSGKTTAGAARIHLIRPNSAVGPSVDGGSRGQPGVASMRGQDRVVGPESHSPWLGGLILAQGRACRIMSKKSWIAVGEMMAWEIFDINTGTHSIAQARVKCDIMTSVGSGSGQ